MLNVRNAVIQKLLNFLQPVAIFLFIYTVSCLTVAGTTYFYGFAYGIQTAPLIFCWEHP